MSTERPRPGLAVCLVSGGMDSCVTAACAARDWTDLAFLHVTYGQRTAARERRSFDALAAHFGVARHPVVDLEHLARVGGSSLFGDGPPVPVAGETPADGIPSTYVPFRNGILLALATGMAEAWGGRAVYLGAVEEDSSGYPDCRAAFVEAFARAVELGTRPDASIAIVTPVIGLSKTEIVRLGRELGAPLHLTWSCYVDDDRACGRCDSCRLRRGAFRGAGIEDPVPYRED